MEGRNINMPIGSGGGFFESIFIIDFLKVSIYIILFMYAIFALLIVKQVGIMSRTLITPVSPVVKTFAILHAVFAVGFLLFVIGMI